MREFFGCYLLKSQHPLARGRSYIGFTVNPRRRIRQHNGHLTCGAKQTRKYRPWEMTLVLYGFPTQVQALQFEWAWQHPLKSKIVRAAAVQLGKTKLMGLKGKIMLLHEMLHLSPWKLYPLTLQFLAPEFALLAKGSKTPPRHIQVLVAPPEQLPECLYDDDEAEIKHSREAAVPGCTADGSSDGSSSSEIDEDPSFCSQLDSGSQLQSQQLVAPNRTTISKQALPEPESLSQLTLTQKVVKRKSRAKKLTEPDAESLSQLVPSQKAVKGSSRVPKPTARPITTHTEISTDTESEGGGGSQRSPPASPTRAARVKAVRPVKLKCAVCELAAEQQVLQCAPCGSAFHLQCLADTWSMQQAASLAAANTIPDSSMESGSQMRPSCFGDVPENGSCPVCQEQLGWMNLLQNMQSQGWDQGGRRKGRAKAKASGKTRGPACIDEDAGEAGEAPVKARRARAPSKSKFVALVPATEEYIESLHLLFAPDPTTAPSPTLHTSQAAAPADPLVVVGLPPKRGRGRPGLARSLTLPQATQPSSQPTLLQEMNAHHPLRPAHARQLPGQVTSTMHKQADTCPSHTLLHNMHDINMFPNCQSSPTADQDHSEWEQDWVHRDTAYQEGGQWYGNTPISFPGMLVPPTPIDLLSTSASEGPESPCSRPSASLFGHVTSGCDRGYPISEQQQQLQRGQHPQQQQCQQRQQKQRQQLTQAHQAQPVQALELSGTQGRILCVPSERVSKAEGESTTQPAPLETHTDDMPTSPIRILSFLERVRARAATATAGPAAAPVHCSSPAGKIEHTTDLGGAYNLCDSPPAVATGIHNLTTVTVGCSLSANRNHHLGLLQNSSSTCSVSSSMKGSPQQSRQAAALQDPSCGLLCKGLLTDLPGQTLTPADSEQCCSCKGHSSGESLRETYRCCMPSGLDHGFDPYLHELVSTAARDIMGKGSGELRQGTSCHRYSQQELHLHSSGSHSDLTEIAVCPRSDKTCMSAAEHQHVAPSCQTKLQQPVELRKRGRSPKKAALRLCCTADGSPESVGMLHSSVTNDGSTVSPVQPGVGLAVQAEVIQSSLGVAAQYRVHSFTDSKDNNVLTPGSPFIAPSPCPVRRRQEKFATACLSSQGILITDIQDRDPGGAGSCEVIEIE